MRDASNGALRSDATAKTFT